MVDDDVTLEREPRTAEDIERWVCANVRRLVDLAKVSVMGSSHLADLGLDSAEAAVLAADLGGFLGRPVSPTLLWEFPVIGNLARHLAGERAPRSEDEGEGEHAFTAFVNPHLGQRIQQIRLDKRFVRGTGGELYDEQGRRYLDFVAGYGALPFGHNPPEIWDALMSVRDRELPGFVQPALLSTAGELARRLVAIMPPGLRYVTFTNSGAEAVEAAVKLCRVATGRLGILSTNGGFHGKTLGALSATGNVRYQKSFGAPAPFFEKVPYGDAEAVRRELGRCPGHYAAFIVEAIQGEGGIVEPPPGYLAAVQEVCRSAGVLFVVDEVQTGFGRTGALFASAAEGVSPDVITVAKALGGGLVPIGACVATAAAYTEDFALKHSSTFAGGTMACAAGLATLDLLERDGGALIARVAENGARLKEALVRLQHRHPALITEVRGRGYLLGVRLHLSRRTFPNSVLSLAANQGDLVPLFASYLLNVERMRVAPTLNGTDVMRIEPPLTATWEQCEALVGAVDRAAAAFLSGNAGQVLDAILNEAPAAPEPQIRARTHSPAAHADPIQPAADDGRFAFILHPLELASYVHFDRTLGCAADVDAAVRIIHGVSEPAVVSEAQVVTSSGRSAYGEFIMVARTAAELMAMPRGEAVAEVARAVDLGRRRGARIVGLGAFTSVVTQGGLAVSDRGVPITAGNSFTAVASLEAVRLALRTARPPAPSGVAPVTAIVGAAGSIGRAVAILMAEDASRLILVGNPQRGREHSRRALLEVAGEVCHHVAGEAGRGVVFSPGTAAARALATGLLPVPDAPPEAFVLCAKRLEREHGIFHIAHEAAGALPLAGVVVLATSAPSAIVKPYHLRRNALVCDVSRPRNIREEVLLARPDVLVIDGGVIDVPGRPRLGPFDLEPGMAYACMAETMMLALEQRYAHTSLGPNLAREDLLLVRHLARKHGFKVAALRSFDRPLALERVPAVSTQMDDPP
jgi:acetylornithine/succinyldiaminopimelate/putrescine aminotransferase/predicted amino acid dehydrogenase